MTTRSHPRLLGRATIFLTAVFISATVVATTPTVANASVPDPIDTGAVATCKFTVVDHVFVPEVNPYNILAVGILKKIVVKPPTMHGLTPFDSPVSWRFAIYKVRDWYNGGKWKLAYKSPQQYSVASTTTAADFHKMVYRPPTPNNDDVDPQSKTSYRVEIRMTWWNPDSPVIFSRVSYLLAELHQVVDGVPTTNIQMCYYRELLGGF